MRKRLRGNALPETALIMGLFFLLLFGSINMAFLGFNQMQADGATYIAARAAAAHPTGAPSAAASAVAAIFPRVNTGNIVLTQVGSLIQATYTTTSPGLVLLGNKGTGNFNIYSREVEPTFGSTGAIGTSVGSQYPYTVGSSGLVALNNHPSAYNIWLAQTIKIISSGCKTANGQQSGTTCYDAGEFSSHCVAYMNLKFITEPKIPTVTSTNNAREKELSTDKANWDPGTANSHNSVIYSWDASPHTYPSPKYNGQDIVGGGPSNEKC